jgi:biopolymer transport protein ExbB
VLGITALPLFLYAQESDTPDQAAAEGSGFWHLLKVGGAVGWFIVFCSFISLALIIENFVNIKRAKMCPPEIVAELEALVEEGQYEDAVNLCAANPCFFTNIMGPTLAKVDQGYDEMLSTMQEYGEAEAYKVSQHVSYLSLMGTISPMLGLTGTVTGMIAAFGIIKTMQSPPPSMLAKGVEEALVTTAEGLFVAIPVLAVYFFVKNMASRLIIEIGMVCGEFLDKFKNVETGQKA